MFTVVDAGCEKGMTYREAFDTPLDELELFIYLSNARVERIIDSQPKK